MAAAAGQNVGIGEPAPAVEAILITPGACWHFSLKPILPSACHKALLILPYHQNEYHSVTAERCQNCTKRRHQCLNRSLNNSHQLYTSHPMQMPPREYLRPTSCRAIDGIIAVSDSRNKFRLPVGRNADDDVARYTPRRDGEA